MAAEIRPDDMSVRELVEQASRDLEAQMNENASSPRSGPPLAAAPAPAQEAVAVNCNPLTPEEDVGQMYEWRAVPIVDDGKTMADEMRNLSEVGFFEYASTCTIGRDERLTAPWLGDVHLYRRKKRPAYSVETHMIATLLFQRQMLEHKKEVDQNSVAVAEHRRANPDMGW